MTRQNYYKKRKHRHRLEIDEEYILEQVKMERRSHPRLGTRKLLYILEPQLKKAGISIGRDRMFELLRSHELLIEPVRRMAKTTNSRHYLPVFKNLIKDLEIITPNQVWVSDITYIRTDEGFVYLALIMDLYSRKVVGYHSGDTLESTGAVLALERALSNLNDGSKPIHHSDRGCQYCCHRYVNELSSRGMRISMTEELHCYENSNAERLNGILKQEYGLDRTFRNKEQGKRAVEQAVFLYNKKRPHSALDYQVPEEVYRKVS